jgi:hypothetical protein
MPSPLLFPDTLIPTKINTFKPTDMDFGNSRKDVSNSEISLNRSESSNFSLQLSFKNRREEEVQTFVEFYAQCRGAYRAFYLPDEFWKHGDEIRTAIYNMTQSLLWRFSLEQPTVNTVYVGVYDFSFSMETIKVPYSTEALGNYFPLPVPID